MENRFMNCLTATWMFLVLATPAISADAVVRVYGSAGEVSGSLSIVDLGQTQMMIDCGAYYPHGGGTAAERDDRAALKNNEIPELASQCQYLVWTHVHLDHIGRTPLLIRSGFRGTILATEGTAALAPVMLEMQVRYDAARVRDWSWTTSPFRKNYQRIVIKPHWHPNCKYCPFFLFICRQGIVVLASRT
jgi:predicted metal-dependent RNase